MRTTLPLDDELVAEAQRLTGTTEKTALVREALRVLIQRESARRLARLGGTEPALGEIPRRPRRSLVILKVRWMVDQEGSARVRYWVCSEIL